LAFLLIPLLPAHTTFPSVCFSATPPIFEDASPFLEASPFCPFLFLSARRACYSCFLFSPSYPPPPIRRSPLTSRGRGSTKNRNSPFRRCNNRLSYLYSLVFFVHDVYVGGDSIPFFKVQIALNRLCSKVPPPLSRFSGLPFPQPSSLLPHRGPFYPVASL